MLQQQGWWSVPITSLVIFTLYGIEGIGSQLEDPFGYDRNDIKMDAIVEDIREECSVLLSEWRRVGSRGGDDFFVGCGISGVGLGVGAGDGSGAEFEERPVPKFRVVSFD